MMHILWMPRAPRLYWLAFHLVFDESIDDYVTKVTCHDAEGY
jgi:hypothetical protein